MTEKRFEIICEDSSLVDVPLYVISNEKLKFDIYGSKKDAERLCTLLNENEQLKKEGADVERLIDDLGSEELRRQYEEIINGDNDD